MTVVWLRIVGGVHGRVWDAVRPEGDFHLIYESYIFCNYSIKKFITRFKIYREVTAK